jgi:hypothetical protein
MKSQVEKTAKEEMTKAFKVFNDVMLEACEGLTKQSNVSIMERRASICIRPASVANSPKVGLSPSSRGSTTSKVVNPPVVDVVHSDGTASDDAKGSDEEDDKKSDTSKEDNGSDTAEDNNKVTSPKEIIPSTKQARSPDPVPVIMAANDATPDTQTPGTVYVCALLLKGLLRQGNLTVRPKSLTFSSLLMEAPLNIELTQVLSVSKRKTARIFDNAIGISVKGVPDEYFITSFLSRDLAFQEIMGVWQAAVSSTPSSVPPTPTNDKSEA